jgi:hypothetical protein
MLLSAEHRNNDRFNKAAGRSQHLLLVYRGKNNRIYNVHYSNSQTALSIFHSFLLLTVQLSIFHLICYIFSGAPLDGKSAYRSAR